MEIILKRDIPNLGYISDLVTVKDGYARNYLIPQGFAVMASSSNKKINAENLKRDRRVEPVAPHIEKCAEAVTEFLADRHPVFGGSGGRDG